jgi:osmoprotectant transport system ATP-binding protein
VQHDTPENVLAHPLNRFVHNFVGSDRALKRLSRFPVAKAMREGLFISMKEYPDKVKQVLRGDGKHRFIWIVEESGELRGWVHAEDFNALEGSEEAITEADGVQFGVSEDATLREALSRMLAEGVKLLPVLNRHKKVVGEISLGDIEKVTEEASENWRE